MNSEKPSPIRTSNIKSVKEIARELINEGAQAAQNQFRNCVQPIYGVTADGRPDHLGSAILLKLAEGRFMMTAAHNLDWNKTTSLYLGVRKAELLELDATVTVAPNSVRGDDVYDFALARLPEPLITKLGIGNFLDEANISKSIADTVGRSYSCVGYPNSKNRTPQSFERSFTPIIATYTSNGVAIDRLGPDYAAESHILIDFSFKFSRDETGKRVSSIKPNGFSGGAVIDLGRLSDPGSLSALPTPKLIGLFVEAHRAERAIVATRIAPAIAAARNRRMLG